MFNAVLLVFSLLADPSSERSVGLDVELAPTFSETQVLQHMSVWLHRDLLPEPLNAVDIALNDESTSRIHVYVDLDAQKGFTAKLSPYAEGVSTNEISATTVTCRCTNDTFLSKVVDAIVPMAVALNELNTVEEEPQFVSDTFIDPPIVQQERLLTNNPEGEDIQPGSSTNAKIVIGLGIPIAALGIGSTITGAILLSRRHETSSSWVYNEDVLTWEPADVQTVSATQRNAGLGALVGGLGFVAAGTALMIVGARRIKKQRAEVSIQPHLRGLSVAGRF